MPIRSLKLKLVVPRQPDRLDAARSLWTTHAVINEAVRYYETRLLLMRGQRYLDRDGWKGEAEVRQDLTALVQAAQASNAVTEPLDAAAALPLLAQLYTAIVPSALGEKGTAQNANRYLGPLTDPVSRGELDVFAKLAEPPVWVDAVRAGEPLGFEQATTWLASPAGQARLRMTGAPPAWAKAAQAADPTWPTAFVDDLDRKRQEAAGTPTVVRRLKAAGVLPLFPPCVAPQLTSADGVISRWDRLAFRLAVAHLLSWESWSRLAADEHAARRTRVETFRATHLTGTMADRVAALRRYETERKAELERVALPMGERDFLVTERMTRGWPELRDKWLKAKDPSEAALLEIAAKEQTKKRGRFGDAHLIRWLAIPWHHDIWRAEPDAVTLLSRLNAMDRLVERSREAATMTLPDPRHHPRCVQWEAAGGSNLKTYSLRQRLDGVIEATLPVLRRVGDGEGPGLEDGSLTLALAASDQFRDPAFTVESGRTSVTYANGGGEGFHGELGSADLLLDWDHGRHRALEVVEAGDIGPAYLKVALDLRPQLPTGWTGRLPKGALHFQTALGPKSKWAEDLQPGLRVLAIDLGVRSFATGSVFELKVERPASGVAFPTDTGLWAVHERSFELEMPGGDTGSKARAWRAEAETELRRLRRCLGRHRGLLRAALTEPLERLAAIKAWQEVIQAGDGWPFEAGLLEDLERGLELPPPAWEGHVKAVAQRFRTAFGTIVHEWRARTRARGEPRHPGKSMWSIQHLTDVRRFLLSWSLAGRASGDIRRLDRAKGGVFASGLLDHLEGVKEDRLKTGADLIVQAARGYRRDAEGTWVEAFKPCHVILFEDLSRYRTRTDRPRRENSQLMKWAHRAVPLEVGMQGELYGQNCLTTGAAFSSRFSATTMTPGIRCHPLTQKNLEDVGFRDMLLRENDRLDLTALRPGDLVPMGGGEIFAFLGESGLRTIHADVNAAQNLQRRYWTRHGEAFRVPARRVTSGGQDSWVPTRLGKRLQGALGGPGRLVPTGHDSGSCRWEKLTPAAWRKLAGGDVTGDEVGADPDIEELLGLEEEALERSGEVAVFFRDPSGAVLPSGLWYPSLSFWSIVRAKTAAQLKRKVVEPA